MSVDPALRRPKRAMALSKPANDHRPSRRMRARVLIAKDLPVTRIEIEVFAQLVDDLAGLAANGNEVEGQ